MAIKMGPYARREYDQLSAGELNENIRWSQIRLDVIFTNGKCTWKKYASHGYTWNQIAEIDPEYYDWSRGELEWMIANSQAELRRREAFEQRRSALPPPSPPAIEEPQLFTEQEVKEIRAANQTAWWREWIYKGERASSRNYHPDTGGSHELWLSFEKSKEYLERIIKKVEEELKGA